MYPFIYQQLTLLGKKPSTYSLTLEDYYKTKENFIADLLKLSAVKKSLIAYKYG